MNSIPHSANRGNLSDVWEQCSEESPDDLRTLLEQRGWKPSGTRQAEQRGKVWNIEDWARADGADAMIVAGEFAAWGAVAPFESGRQYRIADAARLLRSSRTWDAGYGVWRVSVATGRDRQALLMQILEAMRERDSGFGDPGPNCRRRCIEDANTTLCRPPLSARQLGELYSAVFHKPPEYGRNLFAPEPDGDNFAAMTLSGLDDVITRCPELRAPLITPLLRVGETMNVIAPAKIGKSWLVLDMALAIAAGQDWLGIFPTTPGNVLLIDNELHDATLANRAPKVAEARGIPPECYPNLTVVSLRGKLVDINRLGALFKRIEPGKYRVVVLDALYRFLPPGTNENDNAALAAVYNTIDQYADMLQCAFVLIHHTSKGVQGGKAIVDTGAGAGAISRSADTHLILRAHEEAECFVLETETRSWPKLPPMVLRRDFPIWTVAPELDPAALKVERPRRARVKEQPAPPMSREQFAERFFGPEPRGREEILDLAVAAGMSRNQATTIMRAAATSGLVYRWSGRNGGWSTRPEPGESE